MQLIIWSECRIITELVFPSCNGDIDRFGCKGKQPAGTVVRTLSRGGQEIHRVEIMFLKDGKVCSATYSNAPTA